MYLIGKELLRPEKVENTIKRELYNIENNFSIENREPIKNKINFLASLCKNGSYKESLKFKLLMLILSSSNNYAIEFEKPETIDKVIKFLENDSIIKKHKSKEMFLFNYIYAYSNYAKWILLLSNKGAYYFNNLFYKDNIKFLLNSKCSLLKIYKEDLSKKSPIEDEQRHSYLYLLISVLSTLRRFSEGFQILDTLIKNNIESTFLAGLKTQMLESLKIDTCLSHKTKLIEVLVINCRIFLDNIDSIPFMNNKMQERSVLRLKKIKENYCGKIKIEREKPFVKNENKFIKSTDASTPNKYEQFCSNNYLILNEHKFYCNCKQSLNDNLKIETNHKHTKIIWVDQYQTLLNMLLSNFKYARRNYFLSLNETEETGFNSDLELDKSGLKNEHLKTAFSNCSQILDKIGLGVLDALEIDHKAILRNSRKKIHFLTMWDIDELFDDELIKKNPYLMTLYSIAKDFQDKENTPAFKELRRIRNEIEHKPFFISDKPKNKKKDFFYINKKELDQHCLLMLSITKSAIYSFTYFIRKESISKAKEVTVNGL